MSDHILIVDGKNVATPDGELRCLTPYIQWSITGGSVDLDGEFTAAELRAIADYMESDCE